MIHGLEISSMARLPYDERLKCLIFDRHHYFMTGVVLKDRFKVSVSARTASAAKDMRLWSNEGWATPFSDASFASASMIMFRLRGKQMYYGIFVATRFDATLESDPDAGTMSFSMTGADPVTKAFENPFESGQQVILGNRKWLSEAQGFSGSVFRHTIIGENGSIDWIPVLKNGVPCFYDRLSGGFAYNSGTGIPGYVKVDGTQVSPT